MIFYLLNTLSFVIYSIFIIFVFYTSSNWMHIENFDWYFSYVFIIWVIYCVYKLIQLNFSKDDKIHFSPISIFNYFLGHLFILCLLFFSLNWNPWIWWITLFFKILWFAFFPLFIIFICLSFWRRIFVFLEQKLEKSYIFNELFSSKILLTLSSLVLWFFSFIFVLDFIWIIWFYNLGVTFTILAIFLIVSYKEFIWYIKALYNTKLKFDIKKWSYLYLISTEFLFLVLTLILSVSLINIVRPFPIWWDDLWVYMNYPKLLVQAWKIISLWTMYSWQTFTWIWYMFGSATQAFFFNVIWGFLSIISLILIFADLLKTTHTKKNFFNIPLLMWTVFISMPMVVFQQAKDMKLDTWLFFVSIIALYILFKYTFLYLKDKSIFTKVTDKILNHSDFDKWNLVIFLIIWLLAWFAFSIKFTSLLLISAMIWLLVFFRLWLVWFFAYISLYLWIFTKANLWGYMNVVVNPNNIAWFENNFFYVSIIIWIFLLVLSFYQNKKNFTYFCKEFWLFIIWILIAISPWIWKNIYDSGGDLSIWKIITWTSERYKLDKTKIYSDEELVILNEQVNREKVTSSWTSTNEDFGRYLGYEEGINNYIKLPWNLTMQYNQTWEFTGIGYIYLLFIPLIFVFLPFRKRIYSLWIYVILGGELALFLFIPFKDLMSWVYLPAWYSFIFLFLLLPILYLLFALDNSFKNKFFKINLIFALFYVFLWTISSFWIVWYWIVMYFSFLLMIAFWLFELSSFIKEDNSKEYYIKLFSSLIIFWTILIYIYFSVIPHTFINFKNASYKEYKLWQINEVESPFLYHKDYLNILFELNIKQEKQKEFLANAIGSKQLIDIINQYDIKGDLNNLTLLLTQLEVDSRVDQSIRNLASRANNNIYSWILNPIEEYRNEAIIYRIWTFLKYYISENNNRLLEDSLIFNFNNYIYDEDDKVTVQRLRDLWIKYLLVDLNAATIDKDYENHKLTDRYEKLLKTFTSDQLELVETDNICLKVGLSDYYINKDIDRFLSLAWTNYESFDGDNNIVSRKAKQSVCLQYVLELRKADLINETNFSYLNAINNKITEAWLETDQEILKYLNSVIWVGKKALFIVK